jgi:hypothetical protein
MVANVFNVISSTITSFVSALSSGITAVTGILYDDTDGFTLLGTLLLMAIGFGVVYWIFRLLRGVTAGLAR